MNYGLLKASIDVGNERLENAVAHALGHSVSGGVTTATHDVAEYLKSNASRSVTNPMSQNALKARIKMMGADVDSLLRKSKVVYKGGVGRSNATYTGHIPSDQDIRDMEKNIQDLIKKHNSDALIRSFENALSEGKRLGADPTVITEIENNLATIDDMNDAMKDAVDVLRGAKIGLATAKHNYSTTNATNTKEIQRLRGELVKQNNEHKRLLDIANLAAKNAQQALRNHQSAPNRATAQNLNVSTDELSKVQSELDQSRERIGILEKRIKEALNTDKSGGQGLESKYDKEDNKNQEKWELIRIKKRFEDTSEQWWPGYKSGAYLPADLEAWVRKEKGITTTFVEDGERAYNVSTVANRGTYANHSRYEMKKPAVPTSTSGPRTSTTTGPNPAPKTQRQIDDEQINLLYRSAWRGGQGYSINIGDLAPGRVAEWYHKYYAETPQSPRDDEEVYFRGPSLLTFTTALSSKSNINLWGLRTKSTPEQLLADQLATKNLERFATESDEAMDQELQAQEELERAESARKAAKTEEERKAAEKSAADAAAASAAAKKRMDDIAEAAERAQAKREQEIKDRAKESEDRQRAIDESNAAAARAAAASTANSSSSMVPHPDWYDRAKANESIVAEAVAYIKIDKPGPSTGHPTKRQLHAYANAKMKHSKRKAIQAYGTSDLTKTGLESAEDIIDLAVGEVDINANQRSFFPGFSKNIAILKSGEVSLVNTELLHTFYAAYEDAFTSGTVLTQIQQFYMYLFLIHKMGLTGADGVLHIAAKDTSNLQQTDQALTASYRPAPFSSMFLWM